jgi:hypothetical protein
MLADTATGVAVGVAAAWIGLRLIRWPSRTNPYQPPQKKRCPT